MKKSRFLALSVACTLLGASLSGAVHELGHVIVATCAGLKVVEIQPWFFLGRAHVRFSGSTSQGWQPAIHVAGMLFAVGAGILGMWLVGKMVQRDRAYIPVAWIFLPMLCQALAWVVLPTIIFLGGRAPRDDVTMFIQTSGLDPLVVALLGLSLVLVSTVVVIKTYKTWRAKALQITSVTHSEI